MFIIAVVVIVGLVLSCIVINNNHVVKAIPL